MLLPGANRLALALILVAFAGSPVAAQQTARPQSSRIVAFDETKPAEPVEATPAPAVPAAEPARSSRTVYFGRLVPAAPRLDISRRSPRAVSGRYHFTARPAVASSLSVTSQFGVRLDPFTGAARMHTGVDLAGSYGDSVGAAMSGRVVWASARSGYGNLVVLDHGNGIATYYAHLSAFAVAVGESVEAGQLVGYVGTTGRSTGPHLHYEVRVNGHPIEPGSVIAFDGSQFSVNGRDLGEPGAMVFQQSLPKAPGGTQIGVDWNAALSDDATRKVNGLSVDLE